MKLTIEGAEQEIKNIISTIGSSQEDKPDAVILSNSKLVGQIFSAPEERLAVINKLLNSYQEDV